MATEDQNVVDPGLGNFWREQIEAASKVEGKWRDSAKAIYEMYACGPGNKAAGGMNILYANTKTIQPALFQRFPRPLAKRRALDKNPISRTSAQMIEKTVTNQADEGLVEPRIKLGILDHLITGRMVMRLAYRYQMEQSPKPRKVEVAAIQAPPMPVDPMTGPLVDPMSGLPAIQAPRFMRLDTAEDVDPQNVIPDEASPTGYATMFTPEREVKYEWVEWQHVPYTDYRQSPAISFDHVTWVAFLSRPTKTQAEQFFGKEKAATMNFGDHDKMTTEEGYTGTVTPASKAYDRARVWEIWDKATRQVIYVDEKASGDAGEALDVRPDPLGLRGFFPMPAPLYSSYGDPKGVPSPEYKAYESQANELNALTAKIRGMVKALRVKLLVSGGDADQLINLLFAEVDDAAEVVPIEGWSELQGAGGIDKQIWFLPLDTIIQAIQSTLQAREAVKQEIYEITGISDILRGSSRASETATAQNIKRQFATLRIDERVRNVNGFLGECVRIHAEIASELFSGKSLREASGMDISDQELEAVLELLGDDVRRRYQIDIETDSTIEPDEIERREGRVAFLQALTQMLQVLAPFVAQGLLSFEVAKELLLYGVKAFPQSRQLEEMLEQMEPPPPPPQEPSELEQKVALKQLDQQGAMEIAQMKSASQTADNQAGREAQLALARLDKLTEIVTALAQRDAAAQPQQGVM